MYVVMEYSPGGELFEKLSQLRRFTEAHAAMMCKWMLQAIDYVHRQKIVSPA